MAPLVALQVTALVALQRAPRQNVAQQNVAQQNVAQQNAPQAPQAPVLKGACGIPDSAAPSSACRSQRRPPPVPSERQIPGRFFPTRGTRPLSPSARGTPVSRTVYPGRIRSTCRRAEIGSSGTRGCPFSGRGFLTRGSSCLRACGVSGRGRHASPVELSASPSRSPCRSHRRPPPPL